MNLVEAYNHLKNEVRRYFILADQWKQGFALSDVERKQLDENIVAQQQALFKLLDAADVPALMGMENLKAERTAQWGNDKGNPKGWDQYRSSTFMEVIRAKWDRALQAQQQFLDAKTEIRITEAILKELQAEPDFDKNVAAQGAHKIKELQEKIEKLEFDGLDSMKDAFNYSRECLQQIEQFPHLYQNNRLR